MDENSVLTDMIGYVAGILLMLSFLPQVIKTWKTKHAGDVSMGFLTITLGAGILYQWYSWRLGLVPVLVTNGFFTFLVIVEIGLKAKYDRRAVREGVQV